MPVEKLTPELVREIRARYEAGGISQRQLAREYGVSQSTIQALLTDVTWTWVR